MDSVDSIVSFAKKVVSAFAIDQRVDMAVELGSLLPYFDAEINPPGVNLYPESSSGQRLFMLANAFWELRLSNLLSGYEEAEFIITPISGTTDLGRAEQQLIVLFAAYSVALRAFQNVNSSFKAVAGPVEYEVQKSATTLKAVLDALKERLKAIVEVVNNSSAGTDACVFDGVIARSSSIAYGETWFVR